MTEPTTGIAERSAIEPRGSVSLRFRGRIADLTPFAQKQLFERAIGTDQSIRLRTAGIIARVRRDGDDALFAMAREFDSMRLDALEVPRVAVRRALDRLDPYVRRALTRAAENIATVHRAFLPSASEVSPEPGVVIGRRPDPLNRVGVYAPGGRASYPSSVLMGAVPARIAGVQEVILCSPPRRDGLPNEVLLAAAALAGVDRVFAVGGAGAIAALAYGTESVPPVDRLIGPGNAYVAEAKLQVAGVVGIDAPAGPSELLVIADETSDPSVVARELVAQAEHDPRACVIAVVVGEASARAVEDAIATQVPHADRREIIDQALAGQGGVLTVDSLTDAVEIANRYAPEHLLVALRSPELCTEVLGKVRNAGTVFVGETASNAFGDYMTGANHVLPTVGLARSYSGLSVLDFFRWTTYQRVDRGAAARLACDVATLAEAEGLPGHARAARAWSDPERATSPSRSIASLALTVRREIAALSTYAEARDEIDAEATNAGAVEWLDLSDNTNLWGSPPAAVAALRESTALLPRYPSPYTAELKESLAQYIGVPNAGIVTGCGSDDVLDAAMRAFGAPGDRIAFSSPTFSMIPVFAHVNGLVPIEVPLRDADAGYDIDADRLASAGAKLIYVCAPNNPTATSVSREALEYVVERAPGIVILDEAYAEFASTTNVDLVSRRGNLFVTRTLSKAFGLAGLRVGYGVADPTLTAFVERARGPYKVTAPSERVALAVLRDSANGVGWVHEHARLAREARDRFAAAVRWLGGEPFPSDANFLFLPHVRAKEVARRLRAARVIVRAMSGLPTTLTALARSNGNALRCGVAPWPMQERALGLLAEALQ